MKTLPPLLIGPTEYSHTLNKTQERGLPKGEVIEVYVRPIGNYEEYESIRLTLRYKIPLSVNIYRKPELQYEFEPLPEGWGSIGVVVAPGKQLTSEERLHKQSENIDNLSRFLSFMKEMPKIITEIPEFSRQDLANALMNRYVQSTKISTRPVYYLTAEDQIFDFKEKVVDPQVKKKKEYILNCILGKVYFDAVKIPK